MSRLYNVIKMIIPGSKQKTYGTGGIKSVKANVPTTETAKKEAAHKIKMAKIPGEVFNKYKKANETIDTALTKTRQDLQKLRGEKPTKSGFSKGKDIKND
jgi:hypothetical protein